MPGDTVSLRGRVMDAIREDKEQRDGSLIDSDDGVVSTKSKVRTKMWRSSTSRRICGCERNRISFRGSFLRRILTRLNVAVSVLIGIYKSKLNLLMLVA